MRLGQLSSIFKVIDSKGKINTETLMEAYLSIYINIEFARICSIRWNGDKL